MTSFLLDQAWGMHTLLYTGSRGSWAFEGDWDSMGLLATILCIYIIIIIFLSVFNL